jgi:hypothetical protein
VVEGRRGGTDQPLKRDHSETVQDGAIGAEALLMQEGFGHVRQRLAEAVRVVVAWSAHIDAGLDFEWNQHVVPDWRRAKPGYDGVRNARR